ncbi:TPA: DUF4760 domain-containing protein [Serratia liquefaciens]
MYRWIKNHVKICLGLLSGILITLVITRIALKLNNIPTAQWFYNAFDAGIVVTISSLLSLYCVNRISKKFPDTNSLLPYFGIVFWTLMLLGYYVLRYDTTYQTALSVLVTGSLAGMGWWIQFITTAASDRRKHTLNIILSTRTCSEYQTHLRNFTRLWRGNRHAPKDLCEWRDDPDKPKFKNANVSKEVTDGINGLLYILNFFEFLAQGVKANDLDDKLLRECFCGFLEGLERRAYFILTEAQKKDKRFFEGIVYLSKRWNNEHSLIEKHRHSSPPVDIGLAHPDELSIQRMLGIMPAKGSPDIKRRRRRAKNSSSNVVTPINAAVANDAPVEQETAATNTAT